MRIRFEEELGLVPVLRRFETDSMQLPALLQERLQTLLQEGVSAADPNDGQLRDAGTLRLTIEKDGNETTFSLRPWQAKEGFRELIDFLRKSAAPVSHRD